MVDKTGRGIVRGVQARQGCEFRHVKAQDRSSAQAVPHYIQRFVPAESAGHRSAGRRNKGGIKSVHIKAEVDLFGKVGRQQFFRQAPARDFRSIEEMHTESEAGLYFFRADVAHSELREAQAEIRDGAMHDGGVGIRAALVFRPQIRMGVDLDDAEAVETLFKGTQRAQADAVFAAQKHRQGVMLHGQESAALDAHERILDRSRAVHGRSRVQSESAGAGRSIPYLKLL